MIQITFQDVVMLQYINFFVTRYNYIMVQVTGQTNNVWLANPGNSKFPVIMITKDNYAQSYTFDDQKKAVFKAISEQLKTQGKRLEIYVSNNSEAPETGDDFLRVAVGPQWKPDPELLNIFPDLDKVYQLASTTDLQNQYVELSHKINQQNSNMIKKAVQAKTFGKMVHKNNKPIVKPYVTYVLMAICIIVYLFSLYLSTITTDTVSIAVLCGAYYKAFVLGLNEWWRLLSAGFVHVSIFHLLMNLMALYYFGNLIENIYGHKNFLIIILGSIIFGNLWVLVGDKNNVANGISGGLYGLMAAIMIYYIDTGAFKIPALRKQFIYLIAVNVMISFMPGISWLAHLGGFIGGFFLSFILFKHSRFANLKKQFIIAGIALCIVMVFLVTKTQLDQIYTGTDNAVALLAKNIKWDWYSNHIVTDLFKYYATHGF